MNVRLPTVEELPVGYERVGLAISTSTSNDELWIFGGSYNKGDGLKISNNIYKVSMKSIIECECEMNEETGEYEVAEEDKEFNLLQKMPLNMRNGQIRMLDTIGSKVFWINVEHT